MDLQRLRELADRFERLTLRKQQYGASGELDVELRSLAEELWPAVGAFGQAVTVALDAIRAAYEAEGAPYGPADAAMWQWADEQAEAARRRRMAEERAAFRRAEAETMRRGLERRRN